MSLRYCRCYWVDHLTPQNWCSYRHSSSKHLVKFLSFTSQEVCIKTSGRQFKTETQRTLKWPLPSYSILYQSLVLAPLIFQLILTYVVHILINLVFLWDCHKLLSKQQTWSTVVSQCRPAGWFLGLLGPTRRVIWFWQTGWWQDVWTCASPLQYQSSILLHRTKAFKAHHFSRLIRF